MAVTATASYYSTSIAVELLFWGGNANILGQNYPEMAPNGTGVSYTHTSKYNMCNLCAQRTERLVGVL